MVRETWCDRRPRVCVVNAGTIRVFRVAKELKDRDLLARCVTSLYVPDAFVRTLPRKGPLGYLGRIAEQRLINRRSSDLNGAVKQWPWPELAHLLLSRVRIGKSHSLIWWRNRLFGKWAARHALDGVDLVWGFDTSSLEVFLEAQRRGISCVLDMSMAHPIEGERILSEHASRCPEYAPDLGKVHKSQAEIERSMTEIELADLIVSPSIFTMKSVEAAGVPSSKIKLNPFGVDLERFRPNWTDKVISPVIFLFVGYFSQRKGIYYALEAWAKANLRMKAQLWLVGGNKDQLKRWSGRLPRGVRVLGRISHPKLAEVYQRAHVFVFPSLIEGFPKVVLEAMASGLPVIGTDYLLEGVIDPGVHGFLVGAGEVQTLADEMHILASDTKLIKEMGFAGRQRTEEYSWIAYGDRCAEICKTLFAPDRAT